MLRIVFTTADLGRVRVADGPHPLWELVLSVNSLQQPELPSKYWGWRDSVGANGRERPQLIPALRAACTLVRPGANFADFLTPSLPELDIQAHLDHMLALPRHVVREDLVRTHRKLKTPPRWAHQLHEYGRLDKVVPVLSQYHELALGPVWNQVRQQVELARSDMAERLLSRGLDNLLDNLHPSMRWRTPVLETDYVTDHTIELEGRGLTLVPAYFSFGGPVTFIDGGLPPTLVFPAGEESRRPAVEATESIDRLGKLIGRTRAQLLTELVVAASTSQLATRLGVSPAAISQHTKVLREAGLLTTSRFGQTVRHALTPLGEGLLRNGV